MITIQTKDSGDDHAMVVLKYFYPMVTVWMLGLAACQSTDTITSHPGDLAGRDRDAAPSDAAPSDVVPDAAPPGLDEIAFRGLLSNPQLTRKAAEEALLQIAHGAGFPLATANGTFIFAHLAESGSWSLAGDFNEWKAQAMNQHGVLWYAEVEIPTPVDAGYKFVDLQLKWVSDPWARRIRYDENGALSLVRAHRPHLEIWPQMKDDQVAPRTVRVWVPQDGLFNRILLMHDGQNLFDPQAPHGGWQLSKSLPEQILVVGIDNTTERIDEYTHVPDIIENDTPIGGKGDRYLSFVQNTLRPWVEQEYGAASIWGVMGSSLGGLISLYFADQHPQDYQFAGSLSGTLGWGRMSLANETIIEKYQKAGQRSTFLFLDSGGSGNCVDTDEDGILDDDPAAQDNYCETLQMRDTLLLLGYVEGQHCAHWYEPDALHSEAAWADRVHRPLQIFAGM